MKGLGRKIGMKAASDAYTRLAAAVLRKLPRGLDVRVHFVPVKAEQSIRDWLTPLLPKGTPFFPQGEGDVGTRLANAFSKAFADGIERVALIGTDCVDLTPRLFETAFDMLDDVDAVVGPCEDGGCYLIALKKDEPKFFSGISWGSEESAVQVVERCKKLGWKHHSLPVKTDVNTAAEWAMVEDLV